MFWQKKEHKTWELPVIGKPNGSKVYINAYGTPEQLYELFNIYMFAYWEKKEEEIVSFIEKETKNFKVIFSSRETVVRKGE